MDSRKRVLIIDDESDFCSLVKTGLEARDEYRVHTAISGKDGLEMARMVRPDVILLDITMPEMDGFKVLERLKKDRNTMSIPVIMLTARDDGEFKQKAARLFDEAYLVKPIEIAVLRATVGDVLKRRGA